MTEIVIPTSDFLLSKFMAGGHLDGINPALTSALHPLMLKATADINPRQKYPALDQSFRLVSHFLNAGVLNSYFYIFHRLPSRWRNKNNDNFGDEYLDGSLPSDSSMTRRHTKAVKDMLNELANYVTFKISEKVSDGARTTETWDRIDLGLGRRQEMAHLYGITSVIRLGQKECRALASAHEESTPDAPLQLILRFEMAVTIVHELTHAHRNLMLAGSTYALQNGEPFLGENAMVAELGFELETRLFGGIIGRINPAEDVVRRFTYGPRRTISGFRGQICIAEWPSQQVVYDYDRGEDVFKCRLEPSRRRPLDMAWRLPIQFIRRLFEENFWVVNGAYLSVTELKSKLRPYRDHGYSFAPHKTLRWQPVKITSNDQLYIPRGYAKAPTTGTVIPWPIGNRTRHPVYSANCIPRISNPWTKHRHTMIWDTTRRGFTVPQKLDFR